MSILITSVWNSAFDRLSISSLLSCIFSGALIYSFIWAIFFCLGMHLLCSKGSEREQWHLLHSLPVFSHFPHYPQANWALLVLIPWVGGFVYILEPSNKLSCEAVSFSCCCLNPHRCFQSEVWGFISPRWIRGLLSLLCSPANRPGLSVGQCGAAGSASGQTAHPVRPTLCQSRSCRPATAMRVLSAPAAHLCPFYRSGLMFLFYLLGVGLPCRSIFCQFWLCEEAQCLPTPPSWFSDLCFLIPAPFPPFFPFPLLADNPPNDLHIYDSVPVLVVCLLCFLDSAVDSCGFVAI